MNQQPAHATHSPTASSPSFPAPRTQIEAMPPLPISLAAALSPASNVTPQVRQQIMLDAAVRHPVFFTDRLKKAPMGVKAGGGSWVSPVAEGYVFNDGVKRDASGARL